MFNGDSFRFGQWKVLETVVTCTTQGALTEPHIYARLQWQLSCRVCWELPGLGSHSDSMSLSCHLQLPLETPPSKRKDLWDMTIPAALL